MTLIDTLKIARNRGSSLICIRTADQTATREGILASYPEDKQPPTVTWDIVRGATPMNEAGRDALKLQ